MKKNELSKQELEELLEMQKEEVKINPWTKDFDEFLALVRKCEGCGKFVIVDDEFDELPIIEIWNGEKIHCCEDCVREGTNYDEDGEYEPDDYQAWLDYKLVDSKLTCE